MKKLMIVVMALALLGTGVANAAILVGGPTTAPDPAFASLELWLSAGQQTYQDQAGTVPAVNNGDPVRHWKNLATTAGAASDAVDYSPYDKIQLQTTGAGLIGSQPTLQFDGDWSYQWIGGTMSVTASKTLIAVFRDTGSSNVGWGIMAYGASGDVWANGSNGIGFGNADNLWDGVNGYGATNIADTAIAAAAVFDNPAGTSSMFVNGVVDPNINNANAASNSNYYYGIGNRMGSAGWFNQTFKGDMAEVFIFNGVLSTEDLGLLYGYLSTKYGIIIEGATLGGGGGNGNGGGEGAIPEPAALGVIGVALLALGRRRK